MSDQTRTVPAKRSRAEKPDVICRKFRQGPERCVYERNGTGKYESRTTVGGLIQNKKKTQ